MTEDDLLTRLPDVSYPAHARPVPRIVERAHEIRRGRRLFATVAIGGLTAGVVAVAALTGPPLGSEAVLVRPAPVAGQESPFPTPEASGAGTVSVDGAECDVLTSSQLSRSGLASIPGLLYLPSTATAGPITGPVMAREDLTTCTMAAPDGIAYTMTDGVVSARLQVSGPGAVNAYATREPGSDTLVSIPNMVSGAQARVYEFHDPSADGKAYLFWEAPDGTTWSMRSEGLTADQLLTAADSMRLTGGHLDTSTAPVGLSQWADVATLAGNDSQTFSYVQMGFTGTPGQPGFEFMVSDRASFTQAPIGGRPVTVGQVTGWWSQGQTGAGGEGPGQLTWQTGGAELRLSAGSEPLTLQQALDVARSVTPVAPGDPRLGA